MNQPRRSCDGQDNTAVLSHNHQNSTGQTEKVTAKETKKTHTHTHKLITRLKMVPFGKDSIFLFVGFANMDFSTLKKIK